jgi:glutamyl-Q tRNA(Asp) synthetase
MSPLPRASIFRFAPTPNGRLHLGHAYSALRNAALRAQRGGRLLLRIEDVDPTRCRPEFETAILYDLAWLGLEFEAPPRRQSDHLIDYAAAFDALQSRGLVYPCFCTRGQIAAVSAGARDPDGAALHRGRCVAVSSAETERRLAAGEPAAWRLDMDRALRATPGALSWSEFGEGDDSSTIEASPEAWGDVVLRGKERPATYHLAVVVDDALQEISDVVRGRDLFASTSVHRLLQALLGLAPPRYRHHRLVLDAAGAKMSKSSSSTPLAELRANGVLAAELRAALGFGGDPSSRLRVVLS